MAQLGTTNIDVAEVKSTIGVSSNDVINLTTSDNINIWSRNRAGYLYNNGGVLGFQKPRGHATADPRGGFEDYNLGDFRLYNHTATPPKMTQLGDIQISETSTLTASLDLGEVDWNNTGTYKHSHNSLGYVTHVWFIVDGSDFKSIPLTECSRYVTADIPVSVSAGSSHTYTIEAALGTLQHSLVKLGTLKGCVGSTTAKVESLNPAYFVGMEFKYGSWDLPIERAYGGEYKEYAITSQTATISGATREVTTKVNEMIVKYYDNGWGDEPLFDCYGDIYMTGFHDDSNEYLCESNYHIRKGFNLTFSVPSSAPRQMLLPGDKLRLVIKNATSNIAF